MNESQRRFCLSDGLILIILFDSEERETLFTYLKKEYGGRGELYYFRVLATQDEKEVLTLLSPKKERLIYLIIDANLSDKIIQLTNKFNQPGTKVYYIFVGDNNQIKNYLISSEYSYIKRPYSINELQKIIERVRWPLGIFSEKHPVTHLPSSELIENELQEIITHQNWHLLFISSKYWSKIEVQLNKYLGDEMDRFMADFIERIVINWTGFSKQLFLGHASQNGFIIIAPNSLSELKEEIYTKLPMVVKDKYISEVSEILLNNIKAIELNGQKNKFENIRDMVNYIIEASK